MADLVSVVVSVVVSTVMVVGKAAPTVVLAIVVEDVKALPTISVRSVLSMDTLHLYVTFSLMLTINSSLVLHDSTSQNYGLMS